MLSPSVFSIYQSRLARGKIVHKRCDASAQALPRLDEWCLRRSAKSLFFKHFSDFRAALQRWKGSKWRALRAGPRGSAHQSGPASGQIAQIVLCFALP